MPSVQTNKDDIYRDTVQGRPKAEDEQDVFCMLAPSVVCGHYFERTRSDFPVNDTVLCKIGALLNDMRPERVTLRQAKTCRSRMRDAYKKATPPDT